MQTVRKREMYRLEDGNGGYVSAGSVENHPNHEVYLAIRPASTKKALHLFLTRGTAAQVAWVLSGVVLDGVIQTSALEAELFDQVVEGMEQDDDDGRDGRSEGEA